MNSPSLLYSCSYHLVHYDVWHKKKEEKDLKLPEICYNGCVYVREDSNPGGLKFWNNNLSTQQMTSTASREGEKKWSASMVCAVSIFPLNRIFLFWGIKFLVHQKIASVPPDHPHSCNWRVWNIHSPRWWSWWVWLWRRRQQRRGRGGRTWRCWKCLIRSCRQKYPRINLRKYVFQPLIAGKNFWNHMNQNNIAAWM